MSFTTLDTMRFIGTVLESSFYGLYCVAFAVYARIRGTKKGGGTNILIYPLSLLFGLCTIFCAVDTAQTLFILRYEGTQDPSVGLSSYNMNIFNTSMYCAITFIAQGTLIHRCWLMWDRKPIVIVVPVILAWLSFGTSLAMIGALVEPSPSRIPDQQKGWIYPLGTIAFSLAIASNGVITGLLALKIFMNYLETLSPKFDKGRVNFFRVIVAILNDSGLLMLGCEIIWLVLFRRRNAAFLLVRGPIVMIYGLTPTLIRQRVGQPMGEMPKEKPKTDRITTIRFAQ
ncbi:hypothetical protein BYT27DRAFT_7192684 [Phlegmacium glaucopus]|nr:hypothetical protein BYT27DRAFT_7192684 [Phlegmacium glaucopus]